MKKQKGKTKEPSNHNINNFLTISPPGAKEPIICHFPEKLSCRGCKYSYDPKLDDGGCMV